MTKAWHTTLLKSFLIMSLIMSDELYLFNLNVTFCILKIFLIDFGKRMHGVYEISSHQLLVSQFGVITIFVVTLLTCNVDI